MRFFGALSPAGPKRADDDWALDRLLPGEQDLWRRMSGPDRRHAVGVARDTAVLLGEDAPGREVTAAALLHDVGKVESSFGTFSRVGITLAAVTSGRSRLVAWAEAPQSGGAGAAQSGGAGAAQSGGAGAAQSGGAGAAQSGGSLKMRTRVGMYLTHDRIGADLLRAAGSDQLTVAWAGEHHQPPETWTVDRRVAQALKDADGD
jgi:hypothetical protein